MLDILATGRVIKIADARSANGNNYTRITMLTGKGGDATLINASVFDADILAALRSVKKGDAISVSGGGSLSAYTKDGEARASLNLFVNRFLSHRAAKQQERKEDGYAPRSGNGGSYEQPWGQND